MTTSTAASILPVSILFFCIGCSGGTSPQTPAESNTSETQVSNDDISSDDTQGENVFNFQSIPDPAAGQLIEWEGWSFRWQFRDIEGLVLTDVYYQGRKVLKYIGLAEIYVPYATGEPRPEDFSLGGFVDNPMPLLVGKDCIPGSLQCRAYQRDGSIADGKTAEVMIHEEPLGLIYAGSQGTGRSPGKMLVLWSMAHFPGTLDGYTYIIRWKFRNDGSLCPEVGATGGLQHLGVGAESGRGHWVGVDDLGNEIFAPSHIHNFYFRIDFDIDGAEDNVVEEFNYELDPTDPTMAAAVWRPFETERGRYLKEQTYRSWRVKNKKSLNAMGHARSYHLMPGGKGAWRDGGPQVVRRGDFFATKFRETEYPYSEQDNRRTMFAISNYVNNEPIDGEDVVVWYRLSFAHHPRSEDWSVQPVVWNSFELMPRDFLDASPISAD